MNATSIPVAEMSRPREHSVEHWAVVMPDDLAIVEGDRQLRWVELNTAADRLAEAFERRGIVAGDVIAIRTQIRLEWAIIATASAKLGTVPLGINWRLTPKEVAYMLGDSGAVGFICDDLDPAPLLPALAGLKMKLVVNIGAATPSFEAWDALMAVAEPVTKRFSAREAPLVIYTSGTTGVPKGAFVKPRGSMVQAMEYARSMAEKSGRAPRDVMLTCFPFSHGSGPNMVQLAYANGSKLIMMSRFDPEAVLQLIERHRVNFWSVVPTMLNRIAALPPEVIARYDVSSMRALSVGGAPVPAATLRRAIEIFGNIVYESYGGTEFGMVCTLMPEHQTRKAGSSGLLHRHVEIRVRDETGRDLPPGEIGEFWIRTPMTIHGYLNRPPLGVDMLEDGFIKSGDVGYVDADNFLFITDRIKDMIISGGVNIYPAEIEAALIEHPAVQDVAVIGIPDEEFGEQVMAFVELKPGHALDPAGLIDFSKDHLASYKRPKSVEMLAELPRNPLGKVVKNILRAPYWVGHERNV